MNPAVLSARVTIGPGGAPVVFDTSKLVNLSRTPMEIHELIVTAVEQADGWSNGFTTPAAVVMLRGALGQHGMTDGYAPMAVLGPSRTFEIEDIRNLPQLITGEQAFGRGVSSTVRWRFHRSVVLRPGSGFNFGARYSPEDSALISVTPFDVRVTLTAVGRYLPQGAAIPAAQFVPYVSATRLDVGDVTTGGDRSRISQQDELRNPMDKPVTIRRIVGMRFIRPDTPTKDFVVGFAGGNDGVALIDDNFTSDLIDFRFADGTKLSDGRVPFDGVFAQRFALEGEFVVKPGGRCVVDLLAKQRTSAATNPYEILKIGIVGDRPEVM